MNAFHISLCVGGSQLNKIEQGAHGNTTYESVESPLCCQVCFCNCCKQAVTTSTAFQLLRVENDWGVLKQMVVLKQTNVE